MPSGFGLLVPHQTVPVVLFTSGSDRFFFAATLFCGTRFCVCWQALPGLLPMPVPSRASASSQQAAEAHESVHDQLVALLYEILCVLSGSTGSASDACAIAGQRVFSAGS